MASLMVSSSLLPPPMAIHTRNPVFFFKIRQINQLNNQPTPPSANLTINNFIINQFYTSTQPHIICQSHQQPTPPSANLTINQPHCQSTPPLANPITNQLNPSTNLTINQNSPSTYSSSQLLPTPPKPALSQPQ